MRNLLKIEKHLTGTEFCQSCGEKLPPLGAHAVACPYCGQDLVSTPVATPPTERPRLTSGRSTAPLAALLSLLVPGAGQVFNGHFLRGFLVLSTFWLVVPWIFGVIDAWVSARRAEMAAGAPQML